MSNSLTTQGRRRNVEMVMPIDSITGTGVLEASPLDNRVRRWEREAKLRMSTKRDDDCPGLDNQLAEDLGDPDRPPMTLQESAKRFEERASDSKKRYRSDEELDDIDW